MIKYENNTVSVSKNAEKEELMAEATVIMKALVEHRGFTKEDIYIIAATVFLPIEEVKKRILRGIVEEVIEEILKDISEKAKEDQ